jgi:hypothetical protein
VFECVCASSCVSVVCVKSSIQKHLAVVDINNSTPAENTTVWDMASEVIARGTMRARRAM